MGTHERHGDRSRRRRRSAAPLLRSHADSGEERRTRLLEEEADDSVAVREFYFFFFLFFLSFFPFPPSRVGRRLLVWRGKIREEGARSYIVVEAGSCTSRVGCLCH